MSLTQPRVGDLGSSQASVAHSMTAISVLLSPGTPWEEEGLAWRPAAATAGASLLTQPLRPRRGRGAVTQRLFLNEDLGASHGDLQVWGDEEWQEARRAGVCPSVARGL